MVLAACMYAVLYDVMIVSPLLHHVYPSRDDVSRWPFCKLTKSVEFQYPVES